jgi:hypothetical protein
MNQKSVKQLQISSRKIGDVTFFNLLSKTIWYLVCIILIECYLTAIIVCETRNYCSVGHPVVCYVNNPMIRTVRYSCLLKKSFCYHKCGILNDNKVTCSINNCVWHFLPLQWKV